jgi:hypothetical protein
MIMRYSRRHIWYPQAGYAVMQGMYQLALVLGAFILVKGKICENGSLKDIKKM